MPPTATRDLLAKYVLLLNRHGSRSEEAQHFLSTHQSNQEFVSLARIARVLKEALGKKG